MTEIKATSRKHFSKSRMHYAAMFSAVLAFLANIAAIVGLLTSHVDELIVAAGTLGLLGGLYLLLRCWGKPVGLYVLFTVAVVSVSSVVLALALQAYNQDQDNDAASGAIPAAKIESETSSATQSAQGKPVDENSEHRVALEKEFTIRASEGLDLDDEKGTLLLQQNKAKAPADLYLGTYALFYTSTKIFFSYQPTTQPSGDPDKDAYDTCKNLTSAEGSTLNYLGGTNIIPGKQYCILTSQGRIALLTMRELVDAGSGSNKSSISFAVKLWN